MKKCSYCGRENTEDAVHCSECATEFDQASETMKPVPDQLMRPEYEFAPLSAEDRLKDLVTLLKCRTLLEADMIAMRLQAAGIEAFLPDEFLMQTIGLISNAFGGVRLQISPKDYEAAREVLTGIEQEGQGL